VEVIRNGQVILEAPTEYNIPLHPKYTTIDFSRYEERNPDDTRKFEACVKLGDNDDLVRLEEPILQRAA